MSNKYYIEEEDYQELEVKPVFGGYFKELLKDIGGTTVILTIGAVGSTMSPVALPVAVVAGIAYVAFREHDRRD